MRKITTIAAIVFSVFTIAVAQPQVRVNVSANFSFDDLNQYGEWVSVSGYGEVWRPYASPEWRPFVYGQWVWSSDGWMWESDEPFGWIVHHYGNWTYDDDWGWVWVPGYDWSPARVEWHVTDNEIGWMPLLPPLLPGHRHHARIEWMVCPLNSFAGVQVHSHVSYRPYSSTVVVRRGPPKIEVVRSHSHAKVVTVTPRKIYVESHQRKFVRVERAYPSNRHSVVVPVGPQYRGKSHHRHNSVTVESRPAPQPQHRSSVVVDSRSSPRVNVTVTNEAPRRHVESSRTVEVQSSHHHGASKVRVESNADDNRHPGAARTQQSGSRGVSKVRVESSTDEEEDHKHGEVRSKVTVRKKD